MISSVEWHPKGWGGEKWIVNNDLYCGKILYFVKGKKCSWHYHNIKDETFYVQSGKILLLTSSMGDTLYSNPSGSGFINPWFPYHETVAQYELGRGDNFHVPPGLRHQMIALEDTELFEFSTKHMEEDSIRVIKGD